MAYLDSLKKISGLTHYYPLASDARDAVGSQHGTANGVSFSGGKAVFNGSSSINLGDHNDFSTATKGALSIVVFLTIDDWKGKGASEYVHWAGKGKSGGHEWTFRHYVKGGSGEAGSRQGRTSFYHFNPAGGLGAGSYYQDGSFPTNERVFVATCNMSQISLAVDGKVRDTDALSGYSIKPQNTGTPAMLGTRGDGTGFLVGKMRRVAFFNKVLSTSEIASIFTARGEADGGGSTPPVEPPPVDPGDPDVPNPPSSDYTATENNIVEKHNAVVARLRAQGLL